VRRSPQQRQIGPFRLFAEPFHQLRRGRIRERFFGQENGAGLIVELRGEMIELFEEFRSNPP